MNAKEVESVAKVGIYISGLNHCGNSCKFIHITDRARQVITGRYEAFCNLYSYALKLDKRRQNYPWKRCAACKANDCSGKVGHKKYPKCPECNGTSFDMWGYVCRACEGCGEKRK